MRVQLPYITHGEHCVPDSTFILRYLQQTYGEAPPNSALQALDPQQQALAKACVALAEARLGYGMGYYRFVAEAVRSAGPGGETDRKADWRDRGRCA